GLVLAVALWVAPLQVQREGEQAVLAPAGHGRQEFARVALGVPFFGVRVGPQAPRFRVEVVEDALHQPGVEEQALDPLAVPIAALVRGPAVDSEGVLDNRDLGAALPGRLLVRLAGRWVFWKSQGQGRCRPAAGGQRNELILTMGEAALEVGLEWLAARADVPG